MTDYYELMRLKNKDLGPNQNKTYHDITIDNVATCGLVDMGEGVTGIIGVYVHPEHRNKGYGDKLMTEALKYCENIVFLSTYFHMQPAIRLYQRHGFVITDYEDDHVYMMWRRNYGTNSRTISRSPGAGSTQGAAEGTEI